MKRKTIFFVVVLALCGCQPSPVPSTPTPTPTPSASASPLASVSPTPKEEIFLLPPFNAKMVDAVVSGRKAISESAQLRIYECTLADLVAREKWNELESIVKSQRKKLQQFRSGIYKLTSFYYALEEGNGFVAGSNHLHHLWRLSLWLQKKPRSAAARVALSRALLIIAQGKVGLPEDDKIVKSFDKVMPKTMAWARKPDQAVLQLLDEARSLEPEDPEILALTLKARRLLKRPAEEVRPLIAQAQKKFPGYVPIWGQALLYETGLNPKFAWWEASLPPETLALVYNYASQLSLEPASWPTLRVGFERALERFPNSLLLRTYFAKVCFYRQDPQRAGQLLSQINLNYEPIGWDAGRFFFDRYLSLGIQPSVEARTPLELEGFPSVPSPQLQKMALRWQVEYLITGRRFKELDEIGRIFRKTKPSYSNGRPLLPDWYSMLAVDRISFRPPEGQEAEFLRPWIESNPQTLDARLALAEILVGFASDARGSGWARDVSDQQWQEFHRYHDEACELFSRILQESKSLDPWMAAFGIRLCKNLEDGKPQAYRLLEQAIAYDPHAEEAYVAMGVLLLPRWAGEDGELEKFLKEREKNFGPGLFGIVALVLSEYSGAEEQHNLTPERVLRSLQAHAKARPTIYNRNLFARKAAIYYEDRAASARAFQMLGQDWDRLAFRNSQAYQLFQKWANNPGVPYPEF